MKKTYNNSLDVENVPRSLFPFDKVSVKYTSPSNLYS